MTMKPSVFGGLIAAIAVLFALSAAAYAQGAAPTPTPEAIMQSTGGPMMQATATPAAMMEPSGAMTAGTATPAAMMAQGTAVAPSTLPVTGGNTGMSWPLALAACAAIALAGLGLRLARAAR